MDMDAPKDKAQGEREKCDHESKEQAQRQPPAMSTQGQGTMSSDIASNTERDFEGGFGGQEDLEDRYATTCGEH